MKFKLFGWIISVDRERTRDYRSEITKEYLSDLINSINPTSTPLFSALRRSGCKWETQKLSGKRGRGKVKNKGRYARKG